MGIGVCVIVGVLIERVIYRPLASRAGANALLAVFVAALGITIAGQNWISLRWQASAKNLTGPARSTYHIRGVHFTNFDVWQALTSLAIVLILAGLLKFTALGRMIKAVRSNPDLAKTIGIHSGNVYLIAFAIGSFCCGVAAFWHGLQFTILPDMGLSPTIFAFVVAFLGGTARSPVRVFIAGVCIGLLEQWANMFVSTRWTQTVIFVVLIIYLCGLSLKGTRFALSFKSLRRPAPAKA
jgi:branched-subunit amino acid ABC-type transport system permease component